MPDHQGSLYNLPTAESLQREAQLLHTIEEAQRKIMALRGQRDNPTTAKYPQRPVGFYSGDNNADSNAVVFAQSPALATANSNESSKIADAAAGSISTDPVATPPTARYPVYAGLQPTHVDS